MLKQFHTKTKVTYVQRKKKGKNSRASLRPTLPSQQYNPKHLLKSGQIISHFYRQVNRQVGSLVRQCQCPAISTQHLPDEQSTKAINQLKEPLANTCNCIQSTKPFAVHSLPKTLFFASFRICTLETLTPKFAGPLHRPLGYTTLNHQFGSQSWQRLSCQEAGTRRCL